MQLGPAGQNNMFGMRPHPQSACENGPSNCNRAGAPCPKNKMWLQTQACVCFKLWGGQLAFAMWCAMCVCVCVCVLCAAHVIYKRPAARAIHIVIHICSVC